MLIKNASAVIVIYKAVKFE